MELANLFPEEEESVRRQLIEAKIFLTYQRQLNNLRIQETAFAARRKETSLRSKNCRIAAAAVSNKAATNWVTLGKSNVQVTRLALGTGTHSGAHMDTPSMQDIDDKGDVPYVVDHMHRTKAGGAGIISMKLVGEGEFKNPDDRQAALNFAFRKAGVDCVTIGFGNTSEVDEAIKRISTALNA
jgi:hypothetical protein